jgi:tight adherence protein C
MPSYIDEPMNNQEDNSPSKNKATDTPAKTSAPKKPSANKMNLLFLTRPAQDLLLLLPSRYVHHMEAQLKYAGLKGNSYLGKLAAWKIYPAVFGATILGINDQILYALVSFLALFFLSDMVLASLVRKRQAEIRNAMPQMLDLMVLCVDAGLALDASVAKVASDRGSVPSALAEELTTLGRDVLLGMNREKAYLELYQRTGVEELRSFSSSLNQSTQLGISVARVLRNQAEFLRSKLSQKAEEKAAKLPILMAFPLWFCVMPALMILVLAPSLLIFFQQVKPMSGMGGL